MESLEYGDSLFNERISMLKQHGYRGFLITKVSKENRHEILVAGQKDTGRTVTAAGETHDEAYRKIIDDIDLIVDDML